MVSSSSTEDKALLYSPLYLSCFRSISPMLLFALPLVVDVAFVLILRAK
jgi:hypothetical protein